MALDLEDKSQNNNTLTNVGAVEVAGLFAGSEKAVDLELGDNDYLWAADSPSLDLSGDFTIEFLFKFESTPAVGMMMALLSKYGGGGQRSYLVGLYNDGGILKLQAKPCSKN